MSRNGPKWLVASCRSSPSAVTWREVPITPALLTSTSIGPNAAAVGARAAHRPQVGEVDLELLERRRRAPRRGWRPRSRRAGLRVAAGQHHPGAAAGQLESGVVAEPAERRTGDHDGAAGLVGDVGELPGVGSRLGMSWGGGEAGEHPLAELPVALDRDRPGSASQRPPASRMKRLAVHAQRHRGRRGGPRRAAGRGRARRSRTRTARCPPCPGPALVPVGAPTFLPSTKPRLSARYSAVCLAGAVSRPPGRPTARRTSCSCIQTSSGRLRSSVRQVHGHSAEDRRRAARAVGRRVREQRGVPLGHRLADLVDDRVGAGVAAVDDADLGVEAHQPGDVRRLADLGGLLGVAGQDALEVRGVAAHALHVPAGQVGRRASTAPRAPARAGRGSR